MFYNTSRRLPPAEPFPIVTSPTGVWTLPSGKFLSGLIDTSSLGGDAFFWNSSESKQGEALEVSIPHHEIPDSYTLASRNNGLAIFNPARSISEIQLQPSLIVTSHEERYTEVAGSILTAIENFIGISDSRPRDDALMVFYWEIGRILAEGRRSFGNDFLTGNYHQTVAKIIANEYTQIAELLTNAGFDIEFFFHPDNLLHLQRLSLVFPKAYLERIVPTLYISSKSLWSHLKTLIEPDDPYERLYYAEMCHQFKWDLTHLRMHMARDRFLTHTSFRQTDAIQRKVLLQLSQGIIDELLYRDLLRLDFLDLTDEQFKEMEETDLENLIVSLIRKVSEEFGEGFTFDNTQVIRPYLDVNGDKREIRLDILGYVNDGKSSYPFIVELKKIPFSEAVFKQCQKYKFVMRGHDENGNVMPPGYLRPNESRTLIMALVPKFDRTFEKIREVGLKGDGRRSSIFVSLYSYRKPPREFLEHAMGVQMKMSESRAERDRQTRHNFEMGADNGLDALDMNELFETILNGNAPQPVKRTDGSKSSSQNSEDAKLPF